MSNSEENNIPVPLVAMKSSGLRGEILVPGDKSISHRALMISAISIGNTRISGLLEGEDVINTAKALVKMGVGICREVSESSKQLYVVDGVGTMGLQESESVLDMGNSGTGCRLMMGLVSGLAQTNFFTGDKSLCKRPMQRVITPLEKMGARFISRSQGRLPLAVLGSNALMPIEYQLPVASAQVKSAIMLAALNCPGITAITEPEPTRDHSERMLNYFGAKVEVEEIGKARRISVHGERILQSPGELLKVPGDPSSAAFPIVAALITRNSEITVRGVCINPLRTGLYQTLIQMGADISFHNKRMECGEEVADITARHSNLKGIEVPAERAPSMIDEYPILAVAASFAEGKTVMRGLKELKVKESDRLQAIHNGLLRCGVSAEIFSDDESADNLAVNGSFKSAGRPTGGAVIETHMDHRIAMSFLVMGLASQKPVTVDDSGFIATSFPGFTTLMQRLGAELHDPDVDEVVPDSSIGKSGRPESKSSKAKQIKVPPMVIAIDGPAASGKGTLARRIASSFGYAYLDTGSLYRAVGLKLIYSDKNPEDVQEAVKAAKSLDIADLANPRLRQEKVGRAASIVSAIPDVRAALLEFQRQFAKRKEGAVLDGRDIGTVVCPDANLKIFITASLAARANRRHRELQGEGVEVVFNSVLRELEERDQRDRERERAPMKPAEDAIIIDTTALTADEVFNKVCELVLTEQSH